MNNIEKAIGLLEILKHDCIWSHCPENVPLYDISIQALKENTKLKSEIEKAVKLLTPAHDGSRAVEKALNILKYGLEETDNV